MRPNKLSDIIGQNKTKKIVNVLVESAKQRNDAIPHQLFGGPSGTGKTTFAWAIANELNSECVTVNAGAVKSKQLGQIIEDLSHKDILFIDEIHALDKKTSESLYHVMEDFVYTPIDRPYELNIPKFTLIGATTEVGTLPRPLRSRFKFIHNFDEYTLDELAQIVDLVFKHSGVQLTSKDICKTVARSCRKNPRQVVNRAEWIRDYMKVHGALKSKQELIEAIKLSGYDENGFTKQDKEYMDLLSNYKDLSLSNLSSKLGIDEKTIKDDIEPFLQRMHLIEIGRAGRSLRKDVIKALETELGLRILED